MKHILLTLLLITTALGICTAQNKVPDTPKAPKKEQSKKDPAKQQQAKAVKEDKKAEKKDKAKAPKPSALIWNETEHDFGKIRQGKPATTKFKVKNKTRSPLLIADIQTSCGCTTPEYSKKPIPPGKSTEIKTVFNAEVAGVFSKQISVFTNLSKNPVVLRIKGEVE
jgi:Protein of unknown function (DUF1573)